MINALGGSSYDRETPAAAFFPPTAGADAGLQVDPVAGSWFRSGAASRDINHERTSAYGCTLSRAR
jgi:hypothetical protein